LDDRTKVERAVIGCMALEGRATDYFVREGGNEDWFADRQCRTGCKAILARHAKGRDVDILLLQQTTMLHEGWWLDSMDATPTAAHVEYYVDLLAKHIMIGKVALLTSQADGKIARLGVDGAEEVVEWLDAAIQSVVFNRPQVESSMKDHATEWLDRMTAPASERLLLDWPVGSITSQLGRVDNELIWISSLPSVGKSALALQWGQILAEQRITNSLLSLESGMGSIASRVIAQHGQMNTMPIRKGMASEEEIAKARHIIANLPDEMRIHHDVMNIDQIRSWAKAEKRKGSRLLQIDNTRHIEIPGASTRVDGMAEMSIKLKRIRDETGLPVVVYHHSKINENGKEDVSWSSDIRRDTDILVFLKEMPDAINHEGDLTNCVMFDLQKQREGVQYCQITLEFKKNVQTFRGWL